MQTRNDLKAHMPMQPCPVGPSRSRHLLCRTRSYAFFALLNAPVLVVGTIACFDQLGLQLSVLLSQPVDLALQ